ncbi:MAG TPA: cupin domain-containing protein [Dongiaceae bacterium]|nr:cupin domain-containing protein [Dongiaceae bacterium]
MTTMMQFPEQVDLLAAVETIKDYWSPRIVARVNDQYVKVAKLHGHFCWHSHAEEDELFLVLRGRLKIEYEAGRVVDLPAGSLHVVPRGVLHNPVAEEECWIALIETVTTKHTGEVETPLTRSLEEQLGWGSGAVTL